MFACSLLAHVTQYISSASRKNVCFYAYEGKYVFLFFLLVCVAVAPRFWIFVCLLLAHVAQYIFYMERRIPDQVLASL
jgi:hypothetical protein